MWVILTLAAGLANLGVTPLEGFGSVILSVRRGGKKGNGWKEEREMQVWGAFFYRRLHTCQPRNRIFSFFSSVYYFLSKVGLRQP